MMDFMNTGRTSEVLPFKTMDVCQYLHLHRKQKCICLQIRGMSVDEAIAQLEFNDKKGAKIMKEV